MYSENNRINDYIFGNSLFSKDISSVIGFGGKPFMLKVIPHTKANEMIIKNHYSHKICNGSFIHLGVFSFDRLLGVLQFGYSDKSVASNLPVSTLIPCNWTLKQPNVPIKFPLVFETPS